jgi:hypothetical protein
VAPLRIGFPGGAGDAEATVLQRNNFSQLLPFSDSDLLRRQLRGWEHRYFLQIMMLLTLLISRKMIFGENLIFARVAGGEFLPKIQTWIIT